MWAKSDGVVIQVLHGVTSAAMSQRGLFILAVTAAVFALWLLRPR